MAIKKREKDQKGVFFFDDDDVCFPHDKREYLAFQKFDKALCEAQTLDKEKLSKNVNLAASIACSLTSSAGIQHVVKRIYYISKHEGSRKETAVFTTDSIMRHVANGADDELLLRYERHLQAHLRNIFKRALRISETRKILAEKFLGKILTKWKQKGWFEKELGNIVEIVTKAAPEVQRPQLLEAENLVPPPELPFQETEDFFDDDMPSEKMKFEAFRPDMDMGGAVPKAGCPATPAQPAWLQPTGPIPATPNVAKFEPKFEPKFESKVEGTPDILSKVPSTPRVMNMVPMTPSHGASPMTPMLGGAPGTPRPGAVPMTPRTGAVPMTPRGSVPMTPIGGGMGASGSITPRMSAAPQTPIARIAVAAAAAAPQTPIGGAQPFTPGGRLQPGTPGGHLQPFTPRGPLQPTTPSAGGVQPWTPRGPAPSTPSMLSPFTPRGPGGASPSTPKGAPVTPGGFLQPFTPRGAPSTPGPSNLQPFTPRGPVPATPGGVLLPFTPRGPVPGASPVTPGASMPFTPVGAVPVTPKAGPPAVPGTPTGGGFLSAAPQTPIGQAGQAVPGTPTGAKPPVPRFTVDHPEPSVPSVPSEPTSTGVPQPVPEAPSEVHSVLSRELVDHPEPSEPSEAMAHGSEVSSVQTDSVVPTVPSSGGARASRGEVAQVKSQGWAVELPGEDVAMPSVASTESEAPRHPVPSPEHSIATSAAKRRRVEEAGDMTPTIVSPY